MPGRILATLASLSRPFLEGVDHLLYPPLCYFCGQPLLPGTGSFCPDCRHALLDDPHEACPHCAATVGPHAVIAGRCPTCRNESFAFEHVLRLGPYENLLREAVLRLKSPPAEGLAEVLAEHWAARSHQALTALGPHLVAPIPLHWRRRLWRGYNQSAAMARSLARALELPFRQTVLVRVRHTPMQTQQAPSGRRENVRGAFRASPRAQVSGLHVLLVDDVMTTGATLHEAALALRGAGAVRVSAAVLARGHG